MESLHSNETLAWTCKSNKSSPPHLVVFLFVFVVCGGLCPNGARSFFALELGAGECGGGTGEQVGAGGGGGCGG